MISSKVEFEEFLRLETDLWRAETRFDRVYMDEILADDFYEVGRSGNLHSRESVLSFERIDIDVVLPLPDFQVHLLGLDVALVSYNTAVTYDGIVEKSRRASLWQRVAGSWKLKYHQGTPYD